MPRLWGTTTPDWGIEPHAPALGKRLPDFIEEPTPDRQRQGGGIVVCDGTGSPGTVAPLRVPHSPAYAAPTPDFTPRALRTTNTSLPPQELHTHTHTHTLSRITPHSVSSQGCDPQAQGPICWLRGSAAGSVSQHLTGTGAQPPLILLSGTGAHLFPAGATGCSGAMCVQLGNRGVLTCNLRLLEPTPYPLGHGSPHKHTHT